jgi:serine/threonine-protein kinase
MEFCSQGSLQMAFDQGPMTLHEVRNLATEVSFGLQTLHTRGMLHRDIKPGNILRDNNGVAKLGDFGLVTDDIILGYASQQGYLDHVAYEVWGGAGTSIRSDIWALGMTLYRLLHGHEWHSRSPKPQTIISAGGFRDTLKWLPHIPQKWRRFIRKTLDDAPQSRYQNSTQVISALASLPIHPDWQCSVTPSEVTWERQHNGRRRMVVWTEHGAQRYQWKAWSEPLGTGRQRTLGGSTKPLSFIQSEGQLKRFFAAEK